MSKSELALQNGHSNIVESVMIAGDLSKLQPSERMMYYKSVCESLNLNPLTKPFDYIVLNGKMTLYAKKDCTDQLRQNNNVSITISNRERMDDLYIVSARATDPTGRTDEAIGAVNIGNLKGDALANALMKAETKAKRRVTLSICGLGFTDETEIESIPGAKFVPIDTETGEILNALPEPKPIPDFPPDNRRPGVVKITKVQNSRLHILKTEKLGTGKESDEMYQKIKTKVSGIQNIASNDLTSEQADSAIQILLKLPDFSERAKEPAAV